MMNKKLLYRIILLLFIVAVAAALTLYMVKPGIFDGEGDFTAEDYENRGIERVKEGDYDAAIADYNRAAKMADSWNILYNRGVARMKKGDYEQALEDFALALKKNPGHFATHLNSGVIYGYMGNNKKVVEQMSMAIEAKPSYGGAYLKRGDAYRALGNTAKARADYLEAKELRIPAAARKLEELKD